MNVWTAAAITVPVTAYYWSEFGSKMALVSGALILGMLVFGSFFGGKADGHGH